MASGSDRIPWYDKPPPEDTSRTRPRGREPRNPLPSRRAAERAAKRDAGIPMDHPVFRRDRVDYRGVPQAGTQYPRNEFNVGTAENPRYIAIDDHYRGHPNFGDHQPHVHARPGQGPTGRDYNHGTIPSTYEHYPYQERPRPPGSSGGSGGGGGGGANPGSKPSASGGGGANPGSKPSASGGGGRGTTKLQSSGGRPGVSGQVAGAAVERKVGSKVASKVGAQVGERVAVKVGVKLGARIASKLLGPVGILVDVGFLVADIVELFDDDKEGRSRFVKKLRDETVAVVQEEGGGEKYNVMVYRKGLRVSYDFNEIIVNKEVPYKKWSYIVLVMDKGVFTNHGEGGYKNWGFWGDFKRDSDTVRFFSR